jgi:hypothetical protein
MSAGRATAAGSHPIALGWPGSAHFSDRTALVPGSGRVRILDVVAFLFVVAGDVTLGGVRGETVTVEELDELLALSDGARRQWLDRHQPALPEGNWWLHLLTLLDHRLAHQPANLVAWAQLKIWLLAQARERSTLSRDDVAERVAYFVSRMRGAGIEAALLPSADTVVRECLDAIPVALEQVATLTDRKSLFVLGHQEMLDSRRAKNLINAAGPHLNELEDPDLAHRLRAWLAIKPLLV